MNKYLFALAFFLGALGIVWMGVGFIDSSLLALSMTIIIAAVYVFGAFELRQFRQATSTLTDALAAIPDNLTELGDWLVKVHASLQNPVRLRIEGERLGLPGPALTPYLVGLLVMLGMLGTFLGMVVTLNGAVFALEKTTDLQAIRSALAVPVKGLGLAFGTSVAGVAASAMLGLMSAFSRRERMQAAQLLDTKIATVLRRFSLAHQRQETFKALQLQSQALPQVADKLQAMMTQMESMHQQLGQQLSQSLLSNQEGFHRDIKGVYTDLASSVDKSLRESLSQSTHAIGESIKPVVEVAMSGIALEAKLMQERVADTVQTQLDGLSTRFSATTTTVADTWTAALGKHEQASANIVTGVERSLDTLSQIFEQRSSTLVTKVSEAYASLQAAHAGSDAARQQAWTQSLEAMSATLTQELQQTSAQTLDQQKQICDTLTKTAQDITDQAQTSANKSLVETTRLITSAEELMRSRIANEAQLIAQQREGIEQLAALLRTELGALRDEESLRGSAAVDRLDQLQNALQTALTSHLTTLGKALEDPITRLIETASEAPRAAAEVIGQLRQEISNGIERDNAMLEERSRIMETFEQRSAAFVATVGDAYASLQTNQADRDNERQQAWMKSLEVMAATLTQELQQTSAQTLSQQKEICNTLSKAAQDITDQAQTSANKSFVETTRLITSAEELMRSRIASEAQWIIQQRESTDQLASLLRTELSALRDEESVRGNAAVERLDQLQNSLQTTLTSHLTTLGTALEDPITRLIETASEAPRAAAEVIGKLREEISKSVARDNELLEERSRIMVTLNSLLDAINHASIEQRSVIDSLVASSAVALNNAGSAFSDKVANEASKLADIAASVTSSAVEVSSLSEAFGFAVQSFSDANEKLIANLQRIEGAMDKSTSRSDEQLAYYVAQAREIIDLSMNSHKEIFEELRQLPSKQVLLAEETKQ